MASKRIAKSAVDWVAFAERVPENQTQLFQAFRKKAESYISKVHNYPENPPPINWASYKSRIALPGLVDKFEKAYQSMKIPFPSENVSPEIDSQEREQAKAKETFKQMSSTRIQGYKKELEKWESMLPIEEMTIQEFAEHFPDRVWNRNNPTWYPHEEIAITPDKLAAQQQETK